VAKLEEKLRDSSLAGPYLVPRDRRVLSGAVKTCGLKLVRVDLKGARDKQHLLGAVAKALKFPEWFGGNWDALEDCLTDLSWNKANGYVVLLEHCAELAKHAPQELAMAMEVFESVAEYWDEQDKPFWTLFDGIEAPIAGIKPLA
jgi:RNAse (barnase) inhibitor barstar